MMEGTRHNAVLTLFHLQLAGILTVGMIGLGRVFDPNTPLFDDLKWMFWVLLMPCLTLAYCTYMLNTGKD